MRTSPILSLVFGLVLAAKVNCLPILQSAWQQSEEDLLFAKRGKKVHAIGQPSELASHLQNANSHLSIAAAHAVAATSKVVTMPAAGAVGIGRKVVDSTQGDTKVNLADGLVIKPFATIYRTATDPFKHGAKALGHSYLAGKSYIKAVGVNSDEKSSHSQAKIDQRRKSAWMEVVRGPRDLAMENAVDVIERENRRPRYRGKE
jgi:hypothetical protein